MYVKLDLSDTYHSLIPIYKWSVFDCKLVSLALEAIYLFLVNPHYRSLEIIQC